MSDGQKPTSSSGSAKSKSNLPVKLSDVQLPTTLLANIKKLELTKGMPPATIIYGTAAGAFLAFAIVLFFGRHWMDGLLTLLPAGVFLGFASHIMKHHDPRR